MWFDFVLYLWMIENNLYGFTPIALKVVIWFRLVSLNDWKQLCWCKISVICSCDLISSCIFEWLKTTSIKKSTPKSMLWFDFVLYLWMIENNSGGGLIALPTVVIWFRLVSLNDWKQHDINLHFVISGCDLISSCIFEWLKTTFDIKAIAAQGLWFDFVLYLWMIENNSDIHLPYHDMLWFDFVLYLWMIENNPVIRINKANCVVIWFRLVSLNDWKQRIDH